MELNQEIIDYAYNHIDVLIKRKRIKGIVKADEEEITGHCIKRLVERWHLYNPARGKWRTFSCCVLETAFAEALRNMWRHKWRFHFQPLPEEEEIPLAETTDDDVLALIDDLIENPQWRQMLKMRDAGSTNAGKIAKECGGTLEEYNRAKEALYTALKERMRR